MCNWFANLGSFRVAVDWHRDMVIVVFVLYFITSRVRRLLPSSSPFVSIWIVEKGVCESHLHKSPMIMLTLYYKTHFAVICSKVPSPLHVRVHEYARKTQSKVPVVYSINFIHVFSLQCNHFICFALFCLVPAHAFEHTCTLLPFCCHCCRCHIIGIKFVGNLLVSFPP